jgi:hypothetical protein
VRILPRVQDHVRDTTRGLRRPSGPGHPSRRTGPTTRTGRSLGEWLALAEASGIDPLDQNVVRRWLRSEHGVPQNSRWAIADAAARAAGWVRPTVEEYIDSQYGGARAALRPIYDALADAITGLGEDVSVEGRGGYTPFVRGRQFAAVAAAARRGQGGTQRA